MLPLFCWLQALLSLGLWPVKVIAPEIIDYATGQPVRPYSVTTYDAAGRPLTVTDPLGAITSTAYDRVGRPIKVTNPLGAESTTTYDPGGLALTVTDARGQTTANEYDALGRLVETTAPTGAVTRFTHDASGNQTSVEDGEGNITTFTYDLQNRVLTETFANGDLRTHTYDALREISRTDALGTTTNSYDALDRLLSVDPPGPDLRHYSYDDGGRLLSVIEEEDPAATVTYTYDALDRATSETSRGVTHTHSYDLRGSPIATTYGSGASVTRAYNDLGLITSLTDNTGRVTQWHYDAASRAVALTLPNGQIQENTHDLAGRLVERVLRASPAPSGDPGAVLAEFTWTHDSAGNVLSQSESWPGEATRAAGARVTTMSYDAAARLLSETVIAPGEAAKVTSYTYDHADNRASKTVLLGGVIETAADYTYNVANQLTSWVEVDDTGTTLRSAAVSYDGRGNRSSQTITPAVGGAETTTYAWDYQNRLLGVSTPGGDQHSYQYDYRTRRIGRGEPGGSTAVSWSGGLSLAEYAVANLATAVTDPTIPEVEYRRGPDMGGGIGGLLHSLRGGVPKYNLSNGRGDIVGQSDAVGEFTWTASYEAFGTRPEETGTNVDRQRANSKEEDPTGLLWEHFRYRDLETGVWLSRDPAGFVDGPNLYAYVRQNPWTKFDPLGLFEKEKATEVLRQTGRAVAKSASRAVVSSPTAPVALVTTGFAATGITGSVAGMAAISQHFHAKELLQQSGQLQPARYGNRDPKTKPNPLPVPVGKDAPPKVNESQRDVMSVHFSETHARVEILTENGGSLTTHRVVLDSNAPDAISNPSEYNGYNSIVEPTTRSPHEQTLQREIPSGESAQFEQLRQISEGGTPYQYRSNSCATHVSEVGAAGGVPLPQNMRIKDLPKELRKQGFRNVNN
jgi:RHS repeat-associated protein